MLNVVLNGVLDGSEHVSRRTMEKGLMHQQAQPAVNQDPVQLRGITKPFSTGDQLLESIKLDMVSNLMEIQDFPC